MNRTSEELKEYSREHLIYEIWMFFPLISTKKIIEEFCQKSTKFRSYP